MTARQDLRNRHPFHNPRLATTLETTGRAAFLRRQLELRIIASVLAVPDTSWVAL